MPGWPCPPYGRPMTVRTPATTVELLAAGFNAASPTLTSATTGAQRAEAPMIATVNEGAAI